MLRRVTASQTAILLHPPLSKSLIVLPSAYASARIPVEIWKLIFVFATGIPRGYVGALSNPFDYSVLRTGSCTFARSLEASYKVKRNLCLVSRKFRLIAEELIFEYLFLRDGDSVNSPIHWSLLVEGFEQTSDKGINSRRRGPGWHVRRLEIDTYNVSDAARILECCPNIRRLAINFERPDSDSDIFELDALTDMGANVAVDGEQPALQQSMLPLKDLEPYPILAALFTPTKLSYVHLQRLEWTSVDSEITNLLFSYLPTLPNLQYIYIYLLYAFYPDDSAKGISLPKVHTMDIVALTSDPSLLLFLFSTWTLDRLHRFTLRTVVDMSNPHLFYKAHGSKIRIHDFIFLGSQTGPAILSLCTSLTDMIMHIHLVRQHRRRLQSKTVTRIGIRGVNFLDPSTFDGDVQQLFFCFETFLLPDYRSSRLYLASTTTIPSSNTIKSLLHPHLFPNLRTVRLLDFSVSFFKEKKWRSLDVVMWGYWIKRFERLDIRLEDHDGLPITIDFSETNVLLPGDEEFEKRMRG